MTTSCFLIGSVPNAPAYGFTIEGDAKTIAAGSRYLYDQSASLSLIGQFGVQAATSVPSISIFIGQDRKVHLSASATFAITWTNTTLRDLLGFTGNLSAASSYDAPNISPLLWSPGRQESPTRAPLGISGVKVQDTVYARSPTQVITATTNNEWRENSFFWRFVSQSRVFDTEAGGEFVTFFQRVCVPAAQFKLYREVTDSTSATSANLQSKTVLGPYKMAPRERPAMEYLREFENHESRSPVYLDVIVVPEFT